MAKAKKLPHTRLAEGEVTGHSHRAIGTGAALYKTGAETLYLSAPVGANVVHEEHQAVTLPPGEYDRVIVLEYDHFAEESRQVVD
jgi:hypothetical protein